MKIFSGDYSKDMWEEIHKAKTITALRMALYTVCCRLQELETAIENGSAFELEERRKTVRAKRPVQQTKRKMLCRYEGFCPSKNDDALPTCNRKKRCKWQA